MLKDDFIKVFIFIALSILSTIYVSFIDKKESLSVICKSFIYIIPIFTFLGNRDHINQYGAKKTLQKEAIILLVCLISYFCIEMFISHMFTNKLYHVSYIVDIFVLLTEFLVLSIMLFIKGITRQICFVLLLVVITVMFVIVSKIPNYYFVIYIFYACIDVALSFELYVMASRYKRIYNDKKGD